MTAKATLHGSITDTGGENAGERGFDWDYDSGAPYAYDWTETDSYGVAAFSHQVTGLTEGVTVYFRAKAHNSAGWGYGGELSFTTPKAWSKTLSEPLGLLDKVVKAPLLVKTESLGLLDTYSRTWAAYRVHSEILGLSDTVVKAPALMKTESLGLIDVYSRTWAAYRTLSELLGLSDTVRKDTAKVLTEDLGLIDTYSRTWTIYRTYSELLGLSDAVAKMPSKTFTEALGLSDTVAKTASIIKAELLGLTDTYSRVWSIYRIYTEVLGLLDSVSYSKNPTVLAKLIRKFIQLESIGGGGER